MLDEFKDSQKIAYELLTRTVKRNKISHAYLIDGNNNELAFDFVMSFVKMLVCDYNYTNYDKCNNCNKCKRIDDGNYTEVKIIETEGLVIKKEQLLELQSDFSKSAIESNKRIYIIKDCDKMNKHASNSLLKFLEEPNDNIIAILFTNDIHKVLSTIRSRCQLIRLVKDNICNQDIAIRNFASLCCDNLLERDKFLNDESKKFMIDDLVSFLNYYEENGLDIMIYLKKMWYNKYSLRADCILVMMLMINFYYDVFKYYYNIRDYFFNDYLDDIKKIAGFNNKDIIISKINVCMDTLEFLRFNLNINLVIDSLFIKLEECKYEYS